MFVVYIKKRGNKEIKIRKAGAKNPKQGDNICKETWEKEKEVIDRIRKEKTLIQKGRTEIGSLGNGIGILKGRQTVLLCDSSGGSCCNGSTLCGGLGGSGGGSGC